MRHALWDRASGNVADIVDVAIVGFGSAVIIAIFLLAGCAGADVSQVGVDSASNFANVTADARCAQEARQAATDAAMATPSDAGPNAEKHARHVAAMAAFDACESKKDGGI